MRVSNYKTTATLCFLLLVCSFYWCEGCLDEERSALLQIKDSVGYLKRTFPWALWVGDDCCQWVGVSCQDDSASSSHVHVVSLYLAYSVDRLGTWYPNATLFAQFNKLEYLDLSGNQIGGWVMPHALCGLRNLKTLDLSGNNLDDGDIPPCLISNLSSLETLDLHWNNLRSLDGYFQMKSLKKLDLGANRLNESVNSLSGSLELPNLQSLYLDGNHLTDRDISSWITNLTSLSDLSLSGNNLKSFGTLIGLCSLRNLNTLWLRNNSFKGQIPTCFKDMYSLKNLDLSFNQFNGSIYSSFFSNLTMMMAIDVSNNKLNGVIPFSMFANLSELGSIDISNNPQAKVEIEHTHWTPTFQLWELILTRCNLSGQSIPSFLYSQQSLRIFEADYSFLSGTVPHWLLYNVSTPLLVSLRGNMLHGAFPQYSLKNSSSMLTKLDISNNNISGTIPPNIGALFPIMAYFNMSTNALQGSIPPSMGELETLEALDLSNNHLFGKMPCGLTQNNPSLKFLHLSNNSFEGQIFTGDSNISELLILRLDNNLFSGIIPQSLSNSLPLMFLDLRNNRLSGTIPSWFQSLPYLVSILLSGNSFTGKIPLSFCQMQNLHTLDLKNNSLWGSIPSCLKNITSFVKNSPISTYLFRMLFLNNESFSQQIKATTNFATKGQVYLYEGIPLSFMTGIDLSMNRLTGEIPVELGNLKELRSLNLSNNLLTGSIPPSLKSLTSLESLDLSYNKLNGSIPFELTSINSLSSFSVAFNNLSGEIPSTAQFTTFNASSFEGNVGLCGILIRRNCSSNDPSQPHAKEEDEEESSILDAPVLFYLWVLFSFALGFSSFALILIFKTKWRQSYFRCADKCIDSITIGIMNFRLYLKR